MKSEQEFISAVWAQTGREEANTFLTEELSAMKRNRKASAMHLVSMCIILTISLATAIPWLILNDMQLDAGVIYALGGVLILTAWLIENRSYKEAH
jgi:hypothetical protein